ncbi:MAG: hypothetical protein GY757_06560 [bacterium]|nr:hypothetical protein [bacterium]
MSVLSAPILFRCLLAGNFYGFYAVLVGAFFIPAFALVAGTWTNGHKLFEILYTIIWYLLLNGAPALDYVGAFTRSRSLGMAHIFLFITVVFLFLSLVGRKRQITV